MFDADGLENHVNGLALALGHENNIDRAEEANPRRFLAF